MFLAHQQCSPAGKSSTWSLIVVMIVLVISKTNRAASKYCYLFSNVFSSYKSQNILVDQKNCCGTLVVDLAWCTEMYNYRNDITQCWKIADLKLAKILEKKKFPLPWEAPVFSVISIIIINNNNNTIIINNNNNNNNNNIINNNNNIISPWEAPARLPLSWGGGLGWLSTDEWRTPPFKFGEDEH